MWPAIVGAIGGMAGQGVENKIFDYYQNKWNRDEQNYQNRRFFEEQNAFNERMANTAHTREVNDMVRAGLNPILSAGGKGAPAPTSATPQPFQPGPILEFPAVHQAMNVANILQNQERIEIDRSKAMAEIAVKGAEVPNKKAAEDLKRAQEALAREQSKNKSFEKAGLIRTGVEWLNKNVPKPTGLKKGQKPDYQNNQF